jgi:hypothetical protein
MKMDLLKFVSGCCDAKPDIIFHNDEDPEKPQIEFICFSCKKSLTLPRALHATNEAKIKKSSWLTGAIPLPQPPFPPDEYVGEHDQTAWNRKAMIWETLCALIRGRLVVSPNDHKPNFDLAVQIVDEFLKRVDNV